MAAERIQKALARLGLGSRRQIESWITAGRITVNGKTAALGDQISMEDTVVLDGKRLRLKPASSVVPAVLLYHKPEGEVCTKTDTEGRKTVFQGLPKPPSGRWIMVGRLDLNTQGLLLFTNDGELAARLMHPSHEIEREYAVRVLGDVSDDMLKKLRNGVILEDGPAKFKHIRFQGGEGKNQWYHVVLTEGRNREVRRLWESQGLMVSRLMRVRFGNIALPKSLRRGKSQLLSEAEANKLRKAVGLTPVKTAEKDKVLKQQTAHRRQASGRQQHSQKLRRR